MFNVIKPHVLATVVGLISLIAVTGCTTGSFTSGSESELDKPLSVPDKYVFFPKKSAETLLKEQNALTNLMVSLESQAKTPEEKAELFYSIGTIYDDLGLDAMARFMYMNSIVQNPNFYRPYEVMGPYFYSDGKVGDAVDSLDSALDLNKKDDDPYIYLHRGIIMYYTGRYQFAFEDMKKFCEKDPFDPYKILCYYFAAEKYLGADNAKELLNFYYEKTKGRKESKDFGFSFVRLYLGQLSVDELFTEIKKVKDNDDLFQEHLCEAYFYVGKYELLKGNDKLAYDYFNLCEAARKYGFLEHRLARHEIDALQRKYNIKKRLSVDSLSN